MAQVDDDLGLALGSLDALDVAFDLVHGDFVGLVNRVPDTQVVAVLGHNDVRVGHPAHILAVVEKGLLLLLFDVIEVELSTLVSEEELVTTWIQL